VIARWVWRGFLVVVLVLVVRFVLVPQFADARTALLSLREISAPLLALGVGLELASIGAYSALSRATLNRSSRPAYFVSMSRQRASITRCREAAQRQLPSNSGC